MKASRPQLQPRHCHTAVHALVLPMTATCGTNCPGPDLWKGVHPMMAVVRQRTLLCAHCTRVAWDCRSACRQPCGRPTTEASTACWCRTPRLPTPLLSRRPPWRWWCPRCLVSSLHAASQLPASAAVLCCLDSVCSCHVEAGWCGSQAGFALSQGGIVGWTADAAAVADALAQ